MEPSRSRTPDTLQYSSESLQTGGPFVLCSSSEAYYLLQTAHLNTGLILHLHVFDED